MISDLSKVAYKGYLYLLSLFHRSPSESQIPPELTDAISKIAAAQKASRQRIDELSIEAAELLRVLTEKERAQIELHKKEVGELLRSKGVEDVFIEEFLKDPSLEKLNELRNKYSGTQE